MAARRPAAPAPPAPPVLRCPTCRSAHAVAAVFDGCSVSWPQQRWLLFRCPACRTYSHIEVSNGRALIGRLDGAPGPAFMPSNGVKVKGLRSVVSGGGITLHLAGRGWLIKAKT